MTLDIREHLKAVDASLPDNLPLLEPERLSGTLPNIFAVAHIFRRFTGESQRGSGVVGLNGWRVVIRVVGRTRNECWWALLQATRALEEKPLSVAGAETSPLEHDTQDVDAPQMANDGRYEASDAWIYTL